MQVHCQADSELSGAILIRPQGRMDAVGSTTFWDQVESEISEENSSVLLDLTDLDFMSSAGVGTLIRLMTRVQQMGGGLTTFGASTRVRAILQVVNLEQVLHLEETEAEARTYLEERSPD